MDGYIYGFALQQPTLPFDSSKEVAEVGPNLIRQFPVDACPHLAEMITEHALQPGYDYADEFEWGLEHGRTRKRGGMARARSTPAQAPGTVQELEELDIQVGRCDMVPSATSEPPGSGHESLEQTFMVGAKGIPPPCRTRARWCGSHHHPELIGQIRARLAAGRTRSYSGRCGPNGSGRRRSTGTRFNRRPATKCRR